MKQQLAFDRDWYLTYDTQSFLSPIMTERQIQLALASLSLLNQRVVWLPMSDLTWDNWENQIARVQMRLMNV